MADHSKIETDSTWTPIRARLLGDLARTHVGSHCEHVSEGCRNCYAESINRRLGTRLDFKPGHRKDIEIFLDEKMLLAPLKWKKPRTIFVCSMTDLFADFVKDEWIDRVFSVMALAPQHRFQVLTKRAKRMREYFEARQEGDPWAEAADYIADLRGIEDHPIVLEPKDMPLPNVWLGVSAEDQARADERIPELLQIPAVVRFVSLEPLLGAIDLDAMPFPDGDQRHRWSALTGQALMYGTGINGNPDMTIRIDKPIRSKLDWAIVGGESGNGARPMHPDWARSIKNQCEAAGVPFFFKQWGGWFPWIDRDNEDPDWRANYSLLKEPEYQIHNLAGGRGFHGERVHVMKRCSKAAAGRLLDGKLHDGMPG